MFIQNNYDYIFLSNTFSCTEKTYKYEKAVKINKIIKTIIRHRNTLFELAAQQKRASLRHV